METTSGFDMRGIPVEVSKPHMGSRGGDGSTGDLGYFCQAASSVYLPQRGRSTAGAKRQAVGWGPLDAARWFVVDPPPGELCSPTSPVGEVLPRLLLHLPVRASAPRNAGAPPGAP